MSQSGGHCVVIIGSHGNVYSTVLLICHLYDTQFSSEICFISIYAAVYI